MMKQVVPDFRTGVSRAVSRFAISVFSGFFRPAVLAALLVAVGGPLDRVSFAQASGELTKPGASQAASEPKRSGSQEAVTAGSVDDFRLAIQRLAVGQSTRGGDGFVEYTRGHAPIILAAPHGGRKTTELYPQREPGDGVLVTDSNTDRLTRMVYDEMSESKVIPHRVVCDLRRKYVDANRPLSAACAEDSPARRVWFAYQAAIEEAKEMVTEEHDRGVFIEFHGHGHPQHRLELGYLLRARQLRLPESEMNDLAKRSSVREIVARGQLPLYELLVGESSLGALLQRQGVASVPSPQTPHPGEAKYFNGGWNTLTHGSRDGGTISAIQIECHRPGFRDSTEALERSAEKMAQALLGFLQHHYPDR